MSVLVAGANGQVGWELARRARGLPVAALRRQELDVTDAGAVTACFRQHRPALVINAAAYTAVDRAESEPAAAYAVNRDGVRNLAHACAENGAALFHLSTDYVFAGDRQGAYHEDDPVAPLGIYGDSKWAGEVVVREALDRHLIIRTSWVFGSHGQNFVTTMLRLGAERDTLRVVNDQHGCPTPAADIAETLLLLANRHLHGEAIEWGTYHYCGTPVTTWYEFALEIFRLAVRHGLPAPASLVPIKTADYPTPALRPANSELDCRRIEERLGIRRRPWSHALSATLMARAQAGAASL